MRVKIARFTDINPADLIIISILTTEPAMTERGRNELDEHQFSKIIYTCTAPVNHDIIPGHTIEVQNVKTGQLWRGKVVSVSINIGDPKIDQTLKIERII